MTTHIHARSAVLIALAAIAGCATVHPRERFGEVEQSIADRSTYRVHWNNGSPADAAAAAQVNGLLATPLDVDAAAQIALLNNHHLQAAYEDLGVAQADLVQAGLLKNPVFDGSVRFVEGGGSPTIDLGVAFDFLDVFFVGLRKRVAAAEFDTVKIDVTSRVLDTVGEVKAAYYTLQAAQQSVELCQQIEQATAASATLAEKLRAAGNNRPLDVAQEQALHEDARLALDVAEADALVAREHLARLMGVGVEQSATWSLAGRLPDPPAEDIALDHVEATALEQSLTLAAARAQVDVELRKLGITRPLAAVPDASVGVSSERQDGEWEVGPAFSLPLPLFSQGQPAIARAEAMLRQARERYRAMRIDVASDARILAARVVSLRQRVDRYRKTILPLRESIVHDTQLQYNAMQVGAFQLLEAKRGQITAAQEYLGILRDYWIARADLELGLHGGNLGEVKHNTEGSR